MILKWSLTLPIIKEPYASVPGDSLFSELSKTGLLAVLEMIANATIWLEDGRYLTPQ